jgi:hypothetical protein
MKPRKASVLTGGQVHEDALPAPSVRFGRDLQFARRKRHALRVQARQAHAPAGNACFGVVKLAIAVQVINVANHQRHARAVRAEQVDHRGVIGFDLLEAWTVKLGIASVLRAGGKERNHQNRDDSRQFCAQHTDLQLDRMLRSLG